MKPLTAQERRVVELLAQGIPCPEIARRMRITIWTVYAYVRTISARVRGDGKPLRRIRDNADRLLAA